MDFERNKGVKEAAGLGIKANAPMIRQLFFLEVEYENDWGSSSVNVRKSPTIISDLEDVFRNLHRIESGELDPEDFAVELETEDNIGSLEPLWQFRGKWVRFQARGFQAVSAYDKPNEFTTREIFIKIPE